MVQGQYLCKKPAPRMQDSIRCKEYPKDAGATMDVKLSQREQRTLDTTALRNSLQQAVLETADLC